MNLADRNGRRNPTPRRAGSKPACPPLPRRADAFMRHGGAFLRHYCAADASLTDAHAQGVDRRKHGGSAIRSLAPRDRAEQGRASMSDEANSDHAPSAACPSGD